MQKITTLFAFLMVATIMEAQNMKEIFKTVPDSILPTLTQNDRLDLIDLKEHNMDNEVNNQLKGKSRMTILTDHLVKVQLSQLSEVQICKLNAGTDLARMASGEYILCLIHSVKSNAWDSNIRFYTPDWKMLGNQQTLLTLPETKDFITRSEDMSQEEYDRLINKASYPLIQADFNDNTTLSLRYTSPNQLDPDFRKMAAGKVKEEIRMTWDGSKMVRK